MVDVKGPAVDPDAFRVEGHCCAIRLPGMANLSGDGSLYRLTPEARAQLVREGVLPAADAKTALPRADIQADERPPKT